MQLIYTADLYSWFTQLIYTANTCNFHFHLTLRKIVTANSEQTANRQQTDSTGYRVAAQLKRLLNVMKQKAFIVKKKSLRRFLAQLTELSCQ